MKLKVTVGALPKECSVETESGECIEGARGIKIIAETPSVTKVHLEFNASAVILEAYKKPEEPEQENAGE